MRTGYVAALLGASQAEGAFGQLEAGYRFLPNLAGFGYARESTIEGGSVGIGVKLELP